MGIDKLNPLHDESPIALPEFHESTVTEPKHSEYYAESTEYPLFSGYREDLEHDDKIAPTVPSDDHLG